MYVNQSFPLCICINMMCTIQFKTMKPKTGSPPLHKRRRDKSQTAGDTQLSATSTQSRKKKNVIRSQIEPCQVELWILEYTDS